MSNLYLIGFMACGKTTLGRALGEATGRLWVDTDEMIERAQGMTVSEIFQHKGTQRFRELEQETLQRLSLEDGLIVATGGGTPLWGNNMITMLATGNVAWLRASKERTLERLRLQEGKRPLMAGKSRQEMEATYDQMMAEREAVYSRAHFSFNSDRLESESEIRQTAMDFIKEWEKFESRR